MIEKYAPESGKVGMTEFLLLCLEETEELKEGYVKVTGSGGEVRE